MIKFIIPGNPISVNHMYPSRGKIRFLSKEGKIYKEKVKVIANEIQMPLVYDITSNDIKIQINYYFGDLRRRDCTNYDKCILDSLTGIFYKDDCQIKRVELEKFIDKINPRTEIRITI